MKKIMAYDLPTRLFHWLFAVLFLVPFAIAKLSDDDSPWFSHHMLLGLILVWVALLRIVWGFVGSRYARFSELPLSPVRLIEYFREILSSKGSRYLGHNPASAWAGLAMIALALGLGATGYLMVSDYKETFEDAHELMANAFIFVVIAHIAGVVLHSLRHRDAIALSMIHGKKLRLEQEPGIQSSHRLVAMGMAGLIGLFAFQVYKNYDASNSTTSVFGLSLELGGSDSAEHHDD